MTRTSPLLGALAAMALLVLAQTIDRVQPAQGAPTAATEADPVVVAWPDPAAIAVDELAAWPAAAGR
jgi:hypothetical protein